MFTDCHCFKGKVQSFPKIKYFHTDFFHVNDETLCVVLSLQLLLPWETKKKGLEKRPQGTGVHVTQDIPQLRLQKSPIHHNKEILKFSNNNKCHVFKEGLRYNTPLKIPCHSEYTLKNYVRHFTMKKASMTQPNSTW